MNKRNSQENAKGTRIETGKAKSVDRHSSKTPVPSNLSNVKEGYSANNDLARQRNSKTPLPPSSESNQIPKEVTHPKPTIKKLDKNDVNQQTSYFKVQDQIGIRTSHRVNQKKKQNLEDKYLRTFRLILIIFLINNRPLLIESSCHITKCTEICLNFLHEKLQ